MKTVEKIEARKPPLPVRKRVAAYARVSMESERMQHSLSAQVSYYSDFIQKNPEWEYAGVYADYGISGTGTRKREDFNRMIADADAGRIDIILTKSIQRFARNTVDLLNTVRHLKDIGVEVRFEKENINSMSGDGELMLSILASFAQEESRSISENVRWATIKRFKQGIPNGKFSIFGYRWEGEQLVIIPEEAEIIRWMYAEYMKGASRIEIGRMLMDRGIYTRQGKPWVDSNVKVILTNITYTGNMLFQKEYCADPITKRRRKNYGELPQYFVENTHEAIIPMDDWQAVQAEFKRRKEAGPFGNKALNTCCFTGKIKCPHCGLSYMHNRRSDRGTVQEFWGCGSTKKKGGRCPVKGTVPQKVLESECAAVLGLDAFDEDAFLERVDHIEVPERKVLTFFLKDGTTVTRAWESTAKKDWWTEERREAWGERHKNKATNPNRHVFSEFTGFIKCGCCGANYRSQSKALSDGTRQRTWYCSSPRTECRNSSIKDDTMKALVCDVLGLAEFDEAVMDERLEKATVENNTVTFHFKDGHTESRGYQEKRKGKPWTPEQREKAVAAIRASWTDERRQKMSETVKKIRSEKKWRSR